MSSVKEGGAYERENKGFEGVATKLAGGLAVTIVSRLHHKRPRPTLPVQQETYHGSLQQEAENG